MNFLAHFHLSGMDDALIVGNFLGDFVKGRKYRDYPEDIARGILLHREIDYYTDHHPIHHRSKRRLGDKYGHYAGVAVDMFYDHLLAVHWKVYNDLLLPDFSQHIYGVLKANTHILTEQARYVLNYMSEHDWLLHYREMKGIERALKGISRRTKFTSNLEYAALDLEAHFSEFEQDFSVFYQEIISHTKTFFDQ
jgi:acyl carrier protein phosphodiesterase